jgi:hypothetical protein
MAAESNVIFNLIDHGQYFDAAVSSLCIHFGIPMIFGGNYARGLSVVYLHSEGPCFACTSDALKK